MIFYWLNLSSLGQWLINLDDHLLIKPLMIILGAIPGALSRYYLTVKIAQRFGTNFPLGTLIINVSGALFMGFVVTLATQGGIISPSLQILIMNGFLASYTTFSTFTLDVVNLLRIGSWKKALLYWCASIILGGISLGIGIFIAEIV